MRPVSLFRPFHWFLFLSVAYFSWSAFASVEVAPGACNCRFSHKDYDAEKGYYFDKVDLLPYPTVSGRFGCIYYCEDSAGGFWYIHHVYENKYFGWTKGGVENAKKFICPSSVSRFIPKYDMMGTLMYYQTEPYGNFSAAQSSIPEVREWAAQSCR